MNEVDEDTDQSLQNWLLFVIIYADSAHKYFPYRHPHNLLGAEGFAAVSPFGWMFDDSATHHRLDRYEATEFHPEAVFKWLWPRKKPNPNKLKNQANRAN